MKAFKSAISEIAKDTFNTGQNKFAAQFTQSRKKVSNYLQRTSAYEGYLVAEMVRTGKKQIIELPPAMDESATDAEDQKNNQGQGGQDGREEATEIRRGVEEGICNRLRSVFPRGEGQT